MYTAILLDGSKNPTSISLDKRDGRPASLSWGGSATNPARHFNFERVAIRDKGQPGEREVCVFKLVGLRMDARVLGLTIDGRPATVADQAERMADEFLYPEKYAEMGQPAAAAAA